MRKFKLRHYPVPGIRNTRSARARISRRDRKSLCLSRIALKRGGLELDRLLGVHHRGEIASALAGLLDKGHRALNDPDIDGSRPAEPIGIRRVPSWRRLFHESAAYYAGRKSS
jgi:hypothetical protein